MSFYKDMKPVYKAQGRLMGESVKAFLESQGINAIIDQDALGPIYGLTIGDLGEVNILVPAEDVEEARRLLFAMESGEFENSISEQLAISVAQGKDIDLSEWLSQTDSDPDYAQDELEDLSRENLVIISLHNASFSLMMEAFIKHNYGASFRVFSVALENQAPAHPLAITIMADNGIYFYPSSMTLDELPGIDIHFLFLLDGISQEQIHTLNITEETRVIDIHVPDLVQDGMLDQNAVIRFRDAYLEIAENIPRLLL